MATYTFIKSTGCLGKFLKSRVCVCGGGGGGGARGSPFAKNVTFYNVNLRTKSVYLKISYLIAHHLLLNTCIRHSDINFYQSRDVTS